MIEQLANSAATTLNGTINNSVTAVVVTSAALFPTTGQFRIKIESELMLVTSVAGNTFTVTRNIEGTAPASHTTGVAVTQVFTKGAIEKFRDDSILIDAFANRPASNKPGLLFFGTDTPIFSRDDGAVWKSFGPIFPIIEPINGDFAWINQGGASVTANNGTIFLSVPTSATDNLRIRKKTAPATPYTITALFSIIGYSENFFIGGLCFRESSSGKVVTFGVGFSTTLGINITKWTNETTFSADYVASTRTNGGQGQFVWLRIADDGSNRICSWSNDGINFIPFHAIGRTDFLTANEVGFFMNVSNVNHPAGLTLLSWKQA